MKGIIYRALYADDKLLVVNPEVKNNAVELLQENDLMLNIVHELQVYLFCKIRFSKGKNKGWLVQPYLTVSLEKKL